MTNKTVGNVSAGMHNVLLQKSGYQDNLTSVTVVDGKTSKIYTIRTYALGSDRKI